MIAHGTNGKVSASQRFTRSNPCPVCGGGDDDKRGQGTRCTGYSSEDGKLAFCSRVTSGKETNSAAGPLFIHRLDFGPVNSSPMKRPKGRGTAYDRPEHAARDQARRLEAISDPIVWIYQDRNGKDVGAAVRFDLADGEKTYRSLHHDAEGHWRFGDPAGLWPLYRLPELLASEGRIYLVEGEKASDAVRHLGLVGTTTSHGAKSPNKSDLTPLAGREIIILPDNDEPGEKYVAAILELLASLEPRPMVKIVHLAGLPAKGDVVDWLKEEIPENWDDEQCRAELDRLAAEAPISTFSTFSTLRGSNTSGDDDESDELIQIDEPPRLAADSPAFVGLLGEIALKHAETSEAPPVSVLAHLLVGFGVVVGRGPTYMVGATRHRPMLFVLQIGPTGRGRKGTAQDIAVAYLDRVEMDFSHYFVRDNFVSAEGLIHAIRDGGDKPGGTEEIRQRMFYLEGEGSRIFDVARREGNTLSGQLRTAWDAKFPLQVGRRNSPDVSSHYTLGVVAHITPEELQMKVRAVDAANGLINRFLIVYAERDRKIAFPPPIVPDDALADRLGKSIAKARKIGQSVQWTGNGQAAYERWYHSQSDLPPGLLGGVLGRREPQVIRLAFIYALADGRIEIDATHLERAAAFWDYCEQSSAYVFGQSLGDPDGEKVLTALASGPQRREFIRGRVFQGNKNKAEIDLILGRLLKAGRIKQESIQTEGRGRKATEFRLA